MSNIYQTIASKKAALVAGPKAIKVFDMTGMSVPDQGRFILQLAASCSYLFMGTKEEHYKQHPVYLSWFRSYFYSLQHRFISTYKGIFTGEELYERFMEAEVQKLNMPRTIKEKILKNG
jgi:hypothetical protein